MTNPPFNFHVSMLLFSIFLNLSYMGGSSGFCKNARIASSCMLRSMYPSSNVTAALKLYNPSTPKKHLK